MNLIEVGMEMQVALDAIEKARRRLVTIPAGDAYDAHNEVGDRLVIASNCLCRIRDKFGNEP